MIASGIVPGLIVAAAVVVVGAGLARRTGGASLLAAGVLLGAVGAAGVTLHGGAPRRHRIVVVDVSDSVASAGRAYLAEEDHGEGLGRDDRISIWTFARAAEPLVGPIRAPDLQATLAPLLGRKAGAGRRGPGSDVAGALDAASATLGSGEAGEVVLATDARCDADAAREAIARLRADGIGLTVHAIGHGARADRRITDVRAPRRAAPGDRVDIVVTVEGAPGAAVEMALEGEGVDRARRTLRLGPSGRARVAFEPRMGSEDLVARVVLAPGDPIPENDARNVRVRRRGRRRVLVVAPRDDPGGATAARALATTPDRYAVERLDPLSAELRNLRSDPPDLVVLADVARAEIPEEALLEVVADGAGLWVTGGRRAFGPGGYAGSRLETSGAMPLWARAGDEREATVVLVVDVSGSMAQTFGAPPEVKARAAREAVAQLLLELPADTRVGLISFANDVRLDVAPVALDDLDARASLDRAVGLLDRDPRGGTEPVAPLRRAVAWLGAAEGRRHLVLVTDGELPGPSAPALAAIGSQLREEGASATVVATGLRERDRDRLRAIGEPVLASDAGALVHAVTEGARGGAGDDEPRRPSEVHLGESTGEWLSGWSPVAPSTFLRAHLPPDRERVAVALEATAEGARHPLLAERVHGLGRVAAMPASLDAWPAGPAEALVRAVAQRLVRRAPEGGRVVDLFAEAAGWHGATLVLEARDARGRPLALATPRVVDGPAFERTGAARWEAALPEGFAPGTRFRVVGERGERITTTVLDPPLPAEYRRVGPDERRLRAWSEMSIEPAAPATEWDGSWIPLALAALLVVAEVGRGAFRRRGAGGDVMRMPVLVLGLGVALVRCGGTPENPGEAPRPDRAEEPRAVAEEHGAEKTETGNAEPASGLPVREPADLEALRSEILEAYVRARFAARRSGSAREIVFDAEDRRVLIGLPDEPREAIAYPEGVVQQTPRTRIRLRADGSAEVRRPRDAPRPRHDVILHAARERRSIAIDVQVDGMIRPTFLSGG